MKSLLLVCCSGLLLAAPFAGASEGSLVTAVFSRVSNGYQREKLPDGTFKREYYALTNGHYYPGLGKNHSIDAVKFPQVARLVSQFLALKNYYLAPDAKSARLLLEIAWGTTIPFNDSVYQANASSFYSAYNLMRSTAAAAAGSAPSLEGIQSPAASVAQAANEEFTQQLYQMQMFEDMRRNADEHNAKLLGYVDEINRGNTIARFAGAGDTYRDLIDDIENERYYVIIAAYDFQAAQKEGKLKPLWITRVSIQAQGNKFNETLAAMLDRASHYFGQDSGRLLRQYQPEGKVKLGELQVMGVISQSELSDRASDGKPEEKKPGG
ncbi:MAG TPA: hypothetical protein VL200_06895 [Lacunisphaera sp.]|jgi:hypothetical protein|nr:hypothetical protein [Lacunisphaera sp.]